MSYFWPFSRPDYPQANDRAGRAVDDLNLICLGGLVVGPAVAWELVQIFLAERHCRRLAKVAEL